MPGEAARVRRVTIGGRTDLLSTFVAEARANGVDIDLHAVRVRLWRKEPEGPRLLRPVDPKQRRRAQDQNERKARKREAA